VPTVMCPLGLPFRRDLIASVAGRSRAALQGSRRLASPCRGVAQHDRKCVEMLFAHLKQRWMAPPGRLGRLVSMSSAPMLGPSTLGSGCDTGNDGRLVVL
jgi:hypothetical protein